MSHRTYITAHDVCQNSLYHITLKYHFYFKHARHNNEKTKFKRKIDNNLLLLTMIIVINDTITIDVIN